MRSLFILMNAIKIILLAGGLTVTVYVGLVIIKRVAVDNKLEKLATINSRVCSIPAPNLLRVMTFNTWRSGGKVNNGLSKVIRQIMEVNPDIVSLQEIEVPSYLDQIVNGLKKKTGIHWEGKVAREKRPFVAILSKHKILNVIAQKRHHYIAANIAVSENLNVSFWAHWNDWRRSGPVEIYKKTIVDNATMMENEADRLTIIKKLVADLQFQKALKTVNEKPILVCGDFNTPSDMDWVYENRHIHFNTVMPWPTTKYLTDEVKMVDSYRKVHPNVTMHPGITWSTVERWNTEIKAAEPQDRIDFIFYKSPRLVPVRSEVMPCTNASLSVCHEYCACGETCKDVKNNLHPSDHYLVYTDFLWK
ncbi:endonuclease/Exonuclease/phosphatase family domain-containing protein [Ditylenchus destructor]|uniref:Endonuclease/Exonuclease/phosphatase family domain-containing protein n=1 Tax=Ditylenchus destructor TaxID=166010 RepID=A0AAD4MMJ7_9BILA|nr:endonuclease/Exonuclease/phosphatase family domain-containing protein [Ditylenchus destructor]